MKNCEPCLFGFVLCQTLVLFDFSCGKCLINYGGCYFQIFFSRIIYNTYVLKREMEILFILN